MAPKRLTNRISVHTKKPGEDRFIEYKANNIALAKKLTQWKTNYNAVLKERNQLQQENMDILVENKHLENRLKNVVIWAQGLLTCIVKGSEYATNIICHADLEQLAANNKMANETIIETQAKQRLSACIAQNEAVNLAKLPDDVSINTSINVEQDLVTDSSISTSINDDDDHSKVGEDVEEEAQKEMEEGELNEEDNDELGEEEEEDHNDENLQNNANSLKRLNTLIEEDTILNSSSSILPEKSGLLGTLFKEVKIALTPCDAVASRHLKRKSSVTPTITSPQTVTKRCRKYIKPCTEPAQMTSPDSVVSSSCSSTKSSIANNQTPNLSTVINNLSDNLDPEQVSITRNSLSNSGNRTLLSPGFSRRKNHEMTTSTPFDTNTTTKCNTTTEATLSSTPVKHTRSTPFDTNTTTKCNTTTEATLSSTPVKHTRLNVNTRRYNTTTETKPSTPVKHKRSLVQKKRRNQLDIITTPPSMMQKRRRNTLDIITTPPLRQQRNAKPKSLKEASLRVKLRR